MATAGDGGMGTMGARKEASKLINTNRSVMQKKYKITDGAQKHVEQSTLLEPANNMPAWQSSDDIKEISAQLAQIKKKHDEVKKMTKKKEDELDKVKKEIDQIGAQESASENSVFR